jgi:hypothetical protein
VLVIVGSNRIQPEESQKSCLECSSPRHGGRLACSVEKAVSEFRAFGLVPHNPGAIPESAYALSECFVVDAEQSTK